MMSNEKVAEVSCKTIITALQERLRADTGHTRFSEDLQIKGKVGKLQA